MKIRVASWRYFIGEALSNLFINRLMTLASSITVIACVVIFCLSVSLVVNLDYILTQLESSVNFNVYLKNEMTDQQVGVLHDKIASIPHVADIKFVSYEEAITRFGDSLGDASILDGLQGMDILPRSFVIEVDDTKYEKQAADAINALKDPGIDQVVYDADVVGKIVAVDNVMRVASVLVILILLFQAFVVIMNTIKLTVNNRRAEIQIMKYIGATDAFIRWPFIFEGLFIGLLGALIAVVASLILYDKTLAVLTGSTFRMLGFIQFVPSNWIFSILAPASLAIGAAVGVFGSFWSVRKYLKV